MLYLILACLVPLFFLIFRVKPSLENLPPGPNTWQLMQKLSELGKNPHIAFKNLSNVYGPIMSLRLGGQLVVVVSSSSVARQVFRTHDSIFSGRYLPSIYYKIPGAPQASIVMSKECDEKWKFLRGLCQNVVFSSRAIESNAFIRKAKAQELVKYLYAKEGQVVDLEVVMGVTIHNVLTNVMVSRDIFDIRGGTMDRKVRSLIGEIIQMVSSLGISDLFPILRSIDFWSNKKGVEIHDKVMSIWSETISQRRAKRLLCENTIRVDLLDVILENGKLSDDEISILLMEILMAGVDSSTVAMVWLVVELLRHPRILKRVRDEIKDAFEGDVMINEAVLTESKYFQACVKETLRFHIPGPFVLPHRATEACEIDGYVIPKDCMVLINAWAIARDPCNWKDGGVFKPERFLDQDKVDCRGAHFEFLPFGAGKRMCPGLNVAFKNMQLIVASLVHFFDWGAEDGSDVTEIDVVEKFETVLKRDKPLCLVPIRRVVAV